MPKKYAEFKLLRVGLLNIGTEDKKGNDLTKQAFQLLKNADLNFVGNVESRDLLNGVADVVVTDGFTGNMALKIIEGTALSLFSMIKTRINEHVKKQVSRSGAKASAEGVKSENGLS